MDDQVFSVGLLQRLEKSYHHFIPLAVHDQLSRQMLSG